MCMFCAAIPAAAAVGARLNNRQIEAKKQAEAAGLVHPKTRPIKQITAGVLVVLTIGSFTFHSLTWRP